MSYEFTHKNYGTKPAQIERVFNFEHFDMRLETKHLMVAELWFNGSNDCSNFLN